MVVAADAGMLSASNLTALDEAGLGFIVGSRAVKAPIDLASHFHWNGDVFTEGQIIDTVTPRRTNSTVNDIAHRAEPVWNRRRSSGGMAGGLGVFGQTSPCAIAGRTQGLRHQHPHHGDGRGRGDRQIPRLLA